MTHSFMPTLDQTVWSPLGISVCHRELSPSPEWITFLIGQRWALQQEINEISISEHRKREKKGSFFFHFQTFQLDTEQWNPFPNSSHFSAAQSASDANASSFSQMVALKVTRRLGPGRKALFYTIPAPSKRQVSRKTHHEPCDPFQMTHGSMSRIKPQQFIQKRQTTTKPPSVLAFN